MECILINRDSIDLLNLWQTNIKVTLAPSQLLIIGRIVDSDYDANNCQDDDQDEDEDADTSTVLALENMNGLLGVSHTLNSMERIVQNQIMINSTFPFISPFTHSTIQVYQMKYYSNV